MRGKWKKKRKDGGKGADWIKEQGNVWIKINGFLIEFKS